jgi:GNAT superfamily N-acetyltransferase
MKIKVMDSPPKELISEIERRIEEFNLEHWEVKEKKPIAIEVRDEKNELLAGAAGKTFGYWLLVDNIWVSENLRGKNIGSQLLSELEKAAINRGCKFSLLDTLNFQARPFYEKFGYKVQWTQDHYPKEGCKIFMVKNLV